MKERKKIMSIAVFMVMLAFFSALTSLVTEGIKNTFLIDVENTKIFSVVALVVALVIGIVGTLLYCHYNYLPINVDNVITAILMGFASALTSMVGYDKVHEVMKML